jgi:hypothetical protein
MIFTNARYEAHQVTGENDKVIVDIDGVTTFVSISDDNWIYREIMRQVEAGELTIAEADE